MKKLYCILALAICAWMPACSDFTDETPVLPQQEEKLSVQVETLGNGNELWTYPNGVRVERTPAGEFFWQGDILLADWQLQALTGPTTRGLILNRPWTDGIVYYEWDTDIVNQTKNMVLGAMKVWTDKCGIEFIDITGKSSYSNRIKILYGESNSSQLGMIGKVQSLSLNKTGSDVYTVIHELGHALGLEHEHCRADRDDYIVIFFDNIYPDQRHNFDKVTLGNNYKQFTEFDYSSVMIYNSFTTDETVAIDIAEPILRRKDGAQIQRRQTPSDLDVKTVNEMYKKKKYAIKARCECSLSGTTVGAGNYTYASTCTLRATPAQNRRFAGWYQDGKLVSTLNPYSFKVAGDQILIARFTTTNNCYSVETSVSKHANPGNLLSPREGGTVSPGSLNATANVLLTFQATSALGFYFVRWVDLDSGETISTKNPCSMKITRDMRVHAEFNQPIMIPSRN